MKDFTTLARAYREWNSAVACALATVVRVHGSSYRSPGARMLIREDGRWVGSISGGCLEGDALRKARQVMREQQAVTVTYDTREESNQQLGIGLGCNGVIDVLIQPIGALPEVWEKLIHLGHPVALATAFHGGWLGRYALQQSPHSPAESSDADLAAAAGPLLQKVFDLQHSFEEELRLGGKTVSVFFEYLQPLPRILLFGAGFDARPVSQLAKSLEWSVEVTDECAAHIAPVFFPSADKLSLCHREQIVQEFSITPHTACVLMSHNYEYDRDVLQKILKSEAFYIGILGPRKRFDRMREELTSAGFYAPTDQWQRVHAPIGLDIGAETPDEIALAIVSEIQAVWAGRTGGFLRHRPAPIHQRRGETDQVTKPVYLS